MPIFTLQTNVPSSKIPQDILQSTTTLLSGLLSVPEGYVCINIQPDQKFISFGGTTEPCAYAQLNSISGINPEHNKKLSADISKHVKTHLGIEPTRMFIKFTNQAASDAGYNGGTLAK